MASPWQEIGRHGLHAGGARAGQEDDLMGLAQAQNTQELCLERQHPMGELICPEISGLTGAKAQHIRPHFDRSRR